MTVESVIDDEVLRQRIRKIMGEPKPETGWARLLKHPLFTLFIGFLLTWGVGTMLTGQMARAREAEEQRAARARARTEGSLKAVLEVSRAVDDRYVRAEMLLASLSRGEPDKGLEERRKAYDDAYVRWRSSLHANLFTIRDAVGQSRYTVFEQALNERLPRHYAALDTLMFRAYDRRRTGAAAGSLADAWAKLTTVNSCGAFVVDRIFGNLAAVVQSDTAAEPEPTPSPGPQPRVAGTPTDPTVSFLDNACPETP
jgi:hypothetical protein